MHTNTRIRMYQSGPKHRRNLGSSSAGPVALYPFKKSGRAFEISKSLHLSRLDRTTRSILRSQLIQQQRGRTTSSPMLPLHAVGRYPGRDYNSPSSRHGKISTWLVGVFILKKKSFFVHFLKARDDTALRNYPCTTGHAKKTVTHTYTPIPLISSGAAATLRTRPDRWTREGSEGSSDIVCWHLKRYPCRMHAYISVGNPR